MTVLMMVHNIQYSDDMRRWESVCHRLNRYLGMLPGVGPEGCAALSVCIFEAVNSERGRVPTYLYLYLSPDG